MNKRIDRLSLRGFRGASRPVEIPFDPHAPITLIFGENGTGKSTICDAIDFICNERFGSLQDKSVSMRAANGGWLGLALRVQVGDPHLGHLP